MIAAAVQTHPEFGRAQANRSRAIELAGSVRADLVVLPELFATGYLFESRAELEALAEPADGPTAQALAAFSRATGATVFAGFAERDNGCIYNSSLLFEKGGLCLVYRKLHLFADESRIFDLSSGRHQVADCAVGRLGPLICFDWIFPEAARSLALAGAQVLVHCANLVLPYCQRAMVTRSIENGVYTVLANRVGREERAGQQLTFTGGSEIIDNRGQVLVAASTSAEEVICAEIEPARADDKWITGRNHLFEDRRPEAYGL
jgi:predicted amidohydrolase